MKMGARKKEREQGIKKEYEKVPATANARELTPLQCGTPPPSVWTVNLTYLQLTPNKYFDTFFVQWTVKFDTERHLLLGLDTMCSFSTFTCITPNLRAPPTFQHLSCCVAHWTSVMTKYCTRLGSEGLDLLGFKSTSPTNGTGSTTNHLLPSRHRRHFKCHCSIFPYKLFPGKTCIHFKLTPWSRVLLEKLIVAQLIEKLSRNS
jgi:hypothetical protein